MDSGEIEIFCGPMFSGKTASLFAALGAAEATRTQSGAFKPALDQRTGPASIATHSGGSWVAVALNEPAELEAASKGLGLVAIDEAQFFDPSIAATARRVAARGGVRVIVAALDFDYRGTAFQTTVELIAVASKVHRLTSVCGRCGKPATHTQRFAGDRPAPLHDPVIKVGSHGLYEPRCLDCWRAERTLELPT